MHVKSTGCSMQVTGISVGIWSTKKRNCSTKGGFVSESECDWILRFDDVAFVEEVAWDFHVL